jgi:hypothetical protein
LAKYEFEEYQWKKGSPIVLNFDADKSETKDLFLEVRSVYGIPYEFISMDFVLEKPTGEEVEFSKEVSFKGENLDCSGDLCDQKVRILSKFNLEKGSYSLKISHFNMDSNIYGLMEFGLIVE